MLRNANYVHRCQLLAFIAFAQRHPGRTVSSRIAHARPGRSLRKPVRSFSCVHLWYKGIPKPVNTHTFVGDSHRSQFTVRTMFGRIPPGREVRADIPDARPGS